MFSIGERVVVHEPVISYHRKFEGMCGQVVEIYSFCGRIKYRVNFFNGEKQSFWASELI